MAPKAEHVRGDEAEAEALLRKIETLERELADAREQQLAATEILQIIGRSSSDLTRVFDAILDNALLYCEAAFGVLWTYSGDSFAAVALKRAPEAYAQSLFGPQKFSPETGHGRIVRGEALVHIADVSAEALYKAGDRHRRDLVELGGARTFLLMPLRKEGLLLGAIQVFRQEVRPFSDRQIALMQSFAAQAVVAMENARLIAEQREALDQQTAAAEVLQVINSSPGDLAPVFDAMLARATEFCEATFGILWLCEGEQFRAAALRDVPAAFAERIRTPHTPRVNNPLERMLRGERLIVSADVTKDDIYRTGDPVRRDLVELGGARSAAQVALRKDDTLLGSLTVYRQEVRPFTEKQVGLLRSFADQAVIAIENARLLEQIRQRQAELRVTFDNMGDGVAMFDENFRLAAWNRNFQQLMELPDEVLAARPGYADYLRILAERGEFGASNVEAELARRLERTDKELRFERTRPNGRILEVRRNVVPDGGFVLIYSDITERKQSEAEIRAARDAAETALGELKVAQASLVHAEKMASLGQLTAGIAHEIKNPLNFVNNFSGLSIELLEELKGAMAPALVGLGEDARSEAAEIFEMLTGNLQKIAEHGRRADGIVKSMLLHSRGGSGERQAINLNGLVEEALNLAYHGARAQDQSFNVTLERDFDHMLQPIDVVPQDVTRVFLNLIGNSFYATKRRRSSDPGFRPTLKLSTRDLGEAVEIRVRDNGTGIAPEIRDRLFQPFFTTKPTGEGTGLGLSISYDIVTQAHGGSIVVTSEVGQFTEFTVRLPRRRLAG